MWTCVPSKALRYADGQQPSYQAGPRSAERRVTQFLFTLEGPAVSLARMPTCDLHSFYPPILARLYTPQGIANRIAFNENMKTLLIQHRQRARTRTPAALRMLCKSDPLRSNLIVPHRLFQTSSNAPFDVIAVCVQGRFRNRWGRCAALVEDYSAGSPVCQGMGKSALTLALMGVSVPYAEVPCPRSRHGARDVRAACERLRKNSPVRLLVGRRDVRVVSTDLLYIAASRLGGLIGGAVVGEPLVAQWDLARHICRHHGMYYKDDCGRVDERLKRYLHEVAARYFLDFGRNGAFSSPARVMRITDIITVRMGKRVQLTSQAALREELLRLMCSNPIKHPGFARSAFWKIDVNEHVRRATQVVEALRALPRFHTLWLDASTATGIRRGAECIREVLRRAPSA